MKNHIVSGLKSLALALLMIAGVSYAQTSGWTAPTATPPAGNTPAPVNVGTSFQTKSGSLDIAGTLSGAAGIFDTIRVNTTTLSPNLSLDVQGRVGATHYCDQNGANCQSSATGMQRRVTGTCVVGSSIRAINADGTVTCEADTVAVTGVVVAGCVANGSAQCWGGATNNGGYCSAGGGGACPSGTTRVGSLGNTGMDSCNVTGMFLCVKN